MTHARPAKAKATYQDVLDAPDGLIAELIAGQLQLQPRPARPHGRAASTLGMLIGPAYQLGRGGPGGWWIEYEPEIHLADDVFVPDLAGWRKDVVPAFDTSVSYVTTPPQWVCEVLSPSTAARDRVLKLPRYGTAGVEHAWLVDPIAHTLEVFASDEAGLWKLLETHQETATVSAPPPFEALSLHLEDLWL